MAFKVDQKLLNTAVGKVTAVVVRSSITNILDCVLLEVRDNRLFVTGSNGEVQVTTSVELAGGSEKAGSFAVNSQKFKAILSNASPGDLSFKRDSSTLNIEIKKGGKYKLALRDGGDFPRLHPAGGDKPLVASFKQAGLAGTLKSILPTISAESHRMYLKGAYFDFVKEGLRIVGTDGHRLACNVLEMDAKENNSFIVPHKALDFLKGNLDAGDAEADLRLSAHKEGDSFRTATFEFAELEVVCQLVTGQYPDYTRVIPTRDNNPLHCVFDRAALRAGVTQVCAVHDKPGDLVELEFTNDGKKLILKARGVHSQDEAHVEVPVEATGEVGELDCQFNSKFLDDLLNAFEGFARILIAFKDGQTSVLVEPVTETPSHLQYVVMPVRS